MSDKKHFAPRFEYRNETGLEPFDNVDINGEDFKLFNKEYIFWLEKQYCEVNTYEKFIGDEDE